MLFELQKANIWKRISAALLDFIFITILITGFAFAISAIAGYTTYSTQYKVDYEEYIATYGDPDPDKDGITSAEINAMDETQKALFVSVSNNYQKTFAIILLIVTFSPFLSFLILEFILPLILKNGQTIGKKIFGLCLVRIDGVKVSPVVLFVRTLLGKYTVETMIPTLLVVMILFGKIGIVGTVVIGLIVLLQLVLIIATKNNSLIHDVLAYTVVVDKATQLIFETPEDRLEYTKRVAAEKAEKQSY